MDDEGDIGFGKRDSFSRILRSSNDDEETLNRILKQSGIVVRPVLRSPPSHFSRILRDPSFSRILRSQSSFSRILRGGPNQFSRILRNPSTFSRILRSPSTFSRILRASPASFSRILRSPYALENTGLLGEIHDRRPNRQYSRILRSDPDMNGEVGMDDDTDMAAEKRTKGFSRILRDSFSRIL